MKKQFVIRSINNSDESLCVDIFQREDKTFGFEEYRRDKETNEGWYKINSYGNVVYSTEKKACRHACKNIPWLDKQKLI